MSHSARAKRMERHHRRNRPATLSLVSLMDIFTILVFFLLVNSSEVQSLEPPKVLKLPESLALEKPRETVIVMVTTEQVLVQGEPVATVADVDAHAGVIIEPLRRALSSRSDRALLRASATDASAREITILADRAIPYRVLKKIMASCTGADYGRLSLAVLQRPEAIGADTGET